MASEKQVQAKRQNALKSTGPTTPEGKAAVRLNALDHGLRSGEILLPGEDGEALVELGEIPTTELQPVGALETSSSPVLLPLLGGSGAWVGSRPAYSPGSFMGSWQSELAKRLAAIRSKKVSTTKS